MVQPNTTGYANAAMSDVWKDFLVNKVNSFIKWDLVRFFHENPHTTDTADNIAFVVGRDEKVTRRELDGLVRVGVLEKKTVSNVTVYTYTADKTVRDRVCDFVTACHDRDFRVKAINQVIATMDVPRHS
ncbi:hypothetical protein G4Y79_19565 [Phototrophicus methaneseepsis]|uniref:Uncharacterized protein n=1 Tax=Phototrophicus methaneseepsis TaxID=2710758 RepID=A0A7S8E7L9_9CHLR|nr:hypothetical protein [Phototrophicus methaneseepsis]QPC81865.1 hypothetical protein G4Y79_19565 [Phototrophicus methaneseepsis]